MVEQPKINLDQLPDWLKNSMQSVFVSPLRKSVLGYRSSPAWKMLLEAAVVGLFLPRDLGKSAVPDKERQDAENVVLEFAEMTQTLEGPKWSLSEEARNQILNVAVKTGEAATAVSQTADRFTDRLSRSLRQFLRQGDFEPDRADSQELEASRIAANLLKGISGIKLPSIEVIESEIEFRRIMAPFERMVGQTTGEVSVSREFFGRSDELEVLREYVGVISSRTIRHFLGRAKKAASRAYHGWRPLSMWGVGGAGKSSLIAKFMVEHARAAQSRFPFVYLDFDRPTISARNQPGLLAEMCIQTGAQFKELAAPMNEMRAELRRLFGSVGPTDEIGSMSHLLPFLMLFRKHIDSFLSSQGSFIELERPFLLVFDTFELVQYSEDDVQGLERFVAAMGASQWSRLRLVISGRQKVETFLGEPQQCEIGPLDNGSCTGLLQQLADDAGKPILISDATKLVKAVARVTEDKDGVHPLRLRLVGNQFHNKSDSSDGPAIVKSLLKELANPSFPTGESGQAFIDGILIRRITGHISDIRVRALANPGLVVRRITPEVIQKVMARGTPRPSSTAEPAGGGVSSGSVAPQAVPVNNPSWIVDDKEALDIFASFGREVSLVERIDDRTLRHRDDVRRQMLPSLRASAGFDRLNNLAYDYYHSLALANKEDSIAAEEAVYHGLWVGIPLIELNTLWPKSITPRIDPAQFDKRSDASVFVRAKLQNRLTLTELSQLPPEITLEWLDARSVDLLKDGNIQGSIDLIQAALEGKDQLLDDRSSTAATLACLYYRAGSWDNSANLAKRHLSRAGAGALATQESTASEVVPITSDNPSQSSPLVSMLRTLATVTSRDSPEESELERILQSAQYVGDPVARCEILAHCVLAQSAIARRSPPGGTSRLSQKLVDRKRDAESQLDKAVQQVAAKQWKKELNVLKLVLAAGCHRDDLLEAWVANSKQVPREIRVDVLESQLRVIFPDAIPEGPEGAWSDFSLINLGSRQSDMPSTVERFSRLDVLWRDEKSALMRSWRSNPEIRRQFLRMAIADCTDWVRPLGNQLTRAFEWQDNDGLSSLLRKQDFLIIRSRQRVDGLGIVQKAHDDGLLFELARCLSEARFDYAHDVAGISSNLLDWQKTIISRFGESSAVPS